VTVLFPKINGPYLSILSDVRTDTVAEIEIPDLPSLVLVKKLLVRLIDQESGEVVHAVPWGELRFGGRRAGTGAASGRGMLEFRAVASGRYELEFGADGYCRSTTELEVITEWDFDQKVTIGGHCRLSGSVSGLGVSPKGYILLVSQRQEVGRARLRDGTFVMRGVPPGRYKVEYRASQASSVIDLGDVVVHSTRIQEVKLGPR
jgi:hypothetical protein